MWTLFSSVPFLSFMGKKMGQECHPSSACVRGETTVSVGWGSPSCKQREEEDDRQEMRGTKKLQSWGGCLDFDMGPYHIEHPHGGRGLDQKQICGKGGCVDLML